MDLVAVMGGEPEAMFRRAITEMGGMKQFIKPGQKVVVKPNIGWDKVPELAGNTNPKLDCGNCEARSCRRCQGSYGF